ncbi:MAG: hypothetical protein ACYTBX_06900 [Planctomycetota bacterium]|jgi:hypothetical protein
MQWIKLISETIIQIVHYAAWPIVVLVVLYWFRVSMTALLGRLKKAGGRDYYAEFGFPELQNQITKKAKLSDVNKSTLTWEDYLDALEHWAFDLGIKLHLMKVYLPVAIDSKGMKHELNQLKIITEKIKKDRPDSTAIKFVRDLMKDINMST